ncbi:DUF6124 family protein [Pseudomonas fluorescens]|uniref:DUF3077 domain-containing protein n=1 Tax=Pseudomonas fluorescens TaxID=294 RepID=A0A5E7D908_PSEFL|nr:DUF6124 family protein [Pseudomonas fluorescens]VVO04494.1 hypothetical protein PS723_02911 [Pseudomonas fluorescens]
MTKVTPDPPETENVSPYQSLDSKKLHQAAHRALDHYLNPPSSAKPRCSDDRPLQIFAVAHDINTQALLAYTYETFSSATTLTLDLSDDLEGKDRNLALAIHQMLELGLLLIEKALDNKNPLKPVENRVEPVNSAST